MSGVSDNDLLQGCGQDKHAQRQMRYYNLLSALPTLPQDLAMNLVPLSLWVTIGVRFESQVTSLPCTCLVLGLQPGREVEATALVNMLSPQGT